MPQMAPLLWTPLSLLFITTLILVMNKIFFVHKKLPQLPPKLFLNTFNWSW